MHSVLIAYSTTRSNHHCLLAFAAPVDSNTFPTWVEVEAPTGEEAAEVVVAVEATSPLVQEGVKTRIMPICHSEHHRQITFVSDAVKKVCRMVFNSNMIVN